jgi:hypothetical protein
MSIVRSAVAAVELTVAVVGVAVAVSRHPLVRAGIKAAPHLMTPGMKQAAAETARNAAYGAGVLARRVVPRSLIG